MTDLEAFDMLRNYVFDSRALRLYHFDDWKEDIRELDMGIRADFSGTSRYDLIRSRLRDMRPGQIISVKDSTQLRAVLFRYDNSRSFYAIGPFRSSPFQEEDYLKIQTMCSGISDLYYLKSLLNPIPVNITELEALTLARHILLHFHRIDQPTVRKIDLSSRENSALKTPLRGDADEAIRRIEETYAHQDRLMNAVTAGNYDLAIEEARFFTAKPPVIRNRTLNHHQSIRTMLFAANTSCRLAAQKAGVHPVHLDDVSQRFNQIISAALTEEQLIQVYTEMLHEYCVMSQTAPGRELSPVLAKIVNYIALHLSGDLSLGQIASALNVSPAYIGKRFKEELHTTPITYITARRIDVAKKMLTESNMSVSEIAQYVGIDDWNYFTKVFKRETGMTPTAFRVNNK